MILYSNLIKKCVINVTTGTNLGKVNDLEIEKNYAKIRKIIVYGRRKCFGLLGREKDIAIPWEDIEKIGEDTILVCVDIGLEPGKRKNFFENFFE